MLRLVSEYLIMYPLLFHMSAIEEDNNRVKKDIIELDSGFPNLLKAYQDAQQLGQLLRKTSSP